MIAREAKSARNHKSTPKVPLCNEQALYNSFSSRYSNKIVKKDPLFNDWECGQNEEQKQRINLIRALSLNRKRRGGLLKKPTLNLHPGFLDLTKLRKEEK